MKQLWLDTAKLSDGELADLIHELQTAFRDGFTLGNACAERMLAALRNEDFLLRVIGVLKQQLVPTTPENVMRAVHDMLARVR